MKKNGSHIGVILSFIIFVIFLAFLYSTLEPLIKVEKGKDPILESLEILLIEKLKTNWVALTITIDNSVNQNCIVLDNLITEERGLNSKIIVRDYDKNIIPSNISESESSDLIVDRDSSDMLFLKIYSSEEFEELNEKPRGECKVLGEGYEIKLLKSSEYISKTKVEKLKIRYDEDYENLKEELNIPEGSDFGFGFIYNDESFIETESKNVSRSVYVEEVPVRYIDSEANILSGYLKVKIW